MPLGVQDNTHRRLLALACAVALPCCFADKNNASMRCFYGEFPSDGFPGPNEALTNAAWTWGRQPKKSECWPMDPATGQPQPCAEVSVIQDTETGWPGKCEGLAHVTNNGAEIADLCGTDCMQKTTCSTWQIGDGETCWQGLGTQCYRRPDFKPKRAQRLQQGEVRVLMNIAGWMITGLDQAFGVKGDGTFQTDEEAISACRKVCYSNVLCNYWTYLDNSGCWMENPAKGTQYTVAYPLTLANANRDSSDAQHCIAGEYIQHYCPSAMVYPPTPPPFPWCQSVGVSFNPADMAGQTRSVEANALLCQARCQGVEGCAYYSYWPADGGCHLQDASARVIAQPGCFAGPANCPPTPEPPSALCSAHPVCAGLGLSGDCCPRDGVVLNCCGKNDTTGDGSKGGDGFIDDDHGTNVGSTSAYALVQWQLTNLTYSCLSPLQKIQLNELYAFELARALGVAINDVRDMTNKQGSVEIVEGTDGATWVQAAVPIVEGKSLNAYRTSVFTDTDPYYFEGNVVNATLDVMGTSPCITGPIKMVDRSVELQSGPSTTTSPEPASWFELWWPLLLALLLLCCAICIVAAMLWSLCKPKSKSKSKRAPTVPVVGRHLALPDSDEQPLLVTADEETKRHLPFPEVGMRSHLPFPEAGLPDDFSEKHHETAMHMHIPGNAVPLQPMQAKPAYNPALPFPKAGVAPTKTTAGQPLYRA